MFTLASHGFVSEPASFTRGAPCTDRLVRATKSTLEPAT